MDRGVVVDDASRDETASLARELPNATVHVHERNLGYGGTRKTCYRLALAYRLARMGWESARFAGRRTG